MPHWGSISTTHDDALALRNRLSDCQLLILRHGALFAEGFRPCFWILPRRCLPGAPDGRSPLVKTRCWEFRAFPVSLQHGAKTSAARNAMRNERRGRVFQRQHILELMAQLAELPESARGRVTLQRMTVRRRLRRPPHRLRCSSCMASSFSFCTSSAAFRRTTGGVRSCARRVRDRWSDCRSDRCSDPGEGRSHLHLNALIRRAAVAMDHLKFVGQSEQASHGRQGVPVRIQAAINFSTSRFCSASSKYIITLRQKMTSLRCGSIGLQL